MAVRKLAEYRKKRDFKKTPEPAAKRQRSNGDLYVVQKHHARRLHYDLRLQVDDVLASWAVPKTPSMDPSVKRLAVHVEDHPLDYGSFEGTIPKGQYGAGKVEIWDKGTWRSLKGDPAKQIKQGKLEFAVQGSKLKGSFVLVQMKGNEPKNWLLKKMQDEEAGDELEPPAGAKPATVPARVKLQLCKPADAPPRGGGWVHEVKWDGYRVLAYVRGGSVRLETRGSNKLSLPHFEKELAPLPDCVLDGEIVAVDSNGRTSFKLVHEALAAGRTSGLIYYVFDAPFADGYDLRGASLLERKNACRRLIERAGVGDVRFSEHHTGSGSELLATACESGLEGIVSKRTDGRYGAGRTGAWVKCRCVGRLSGVVGGYTVHSKAKDAVGALVVGMPDGDGRLLYAGKVGTGFTDKQRFELLRALRPLETKRRPFETVPRGADVRGVRWVEPKVRAEVEFLEWSEGGVMRQPSLVGTDMGTATKPRPKERDQKNGARVATLEITHPGRVIDKESGTTKEQVAEYLASVAARLLPYGGSRPLAVIRCPDGIAGQCFFQKHWMKGLHASVGKVDVGDGEYMEVTDATGLVALAQFGIIEVHAWGSKSDDLDRPDVIVFDLDPGPGVEWKGLVEGALHLRQTLEDFGLSCWARVTGGKGVHVVSPIKPELGWDVVKDFTQRIARALEKADPGRFVSVSTKSRRDGRIFIDYLRNGRGATAVVSYSLRARPGLPVAVPVDWAELGDIESASAWTIENIYDRLEGEDPWKGFARSRRSLKRLMK